MKNKPGLYLSALDTLFLIYPDGKVEVYYEEEEAWCVSLLPSVWLYAKRRDLLEAYND